MQQIHSRTYRIVNEVFNAITHGIGFGLAIAGLVILIIRAVHTESALRVVTFTIYGVILILFYLSSTLFHALVFTKAKHVFQVFDHSAIYLLIAGTYTPYCLLVIKGAVGWVILSIIWIMAICGIVYKSIWLGRFNIVSTVIYVVMGWMCAFAFPELYHGLGTTGFWLLVWGGIAFTVGAVIYSFKQIPFGHVIWHLFVMLGSALMYFSILLYA
ncbi:PAQR family membrane homeostasis protein TrhA [Furfurilactobacillus siliginis]|uniref:Hemolysin III n=1 Tax=Furfurilactobacillus siliginis TaxID=348151 RepID=A0A0R2L5S4_9LACO|nr:hemolysin III family protein [Furfurilactobacillus siliginis]KRN97011.1 hemolysin III-like protein [Furfurilactobacillus siliginis]GEK27770.1 hemolysin III [Furfurilactobacillus siliginis]